MEEDIEKMQDFIMLLRAEPEDNPKAFLEIDYASQKELAQAIENIISKYKELLKERDGIYADYQDLGKEKFRLEEMIELMAEHYSDDTYMSKEDIINYFMEEAKKNERPKEN